MLRTPPLLGPPPRRTVRASSAAPESEVLASLLQADLGSGPLLDTIAGLAAEALQHNPRCISGAASAEVRALAARVATGLAVALLESDLPERISARLAATAPFSDGWRSCPE